MHPLLHLVRRRASPLWFALFVASVCIWVLSLPLFPSQDGPMHRYYAHALAQVLAHNPHYSVYVVRRPFPPYATHYALLLGLSHWLTFDMAEKVVACIAIVCFAYGLRLCATGVGAAGQWVALLIMPLVLPWYLFMGFFNYSLGLGLALLAVGCYLRLQRRSVWPLAGYAACVLVLVVSHPVPMLFLLVFLFGDLLRRRLFVERGSVGWLRANHREIAGSVATVLVAAFPALALDRTKASSTLGGFAFHFQFARSVLLLTGVSPYNSRSHALSVNAYRFCLYALFAVALVWAVRAASKSLAGRDGGLGGSFLVYAGLFCIVLPFIPDVVNGSRFFAMRMTILIFVLLVLAASGRVEVDARLQRMCVALGAVFTVFTLLAAQQVLRPLGQAMHRIEYQSLPGHRSALLLDGPMLPIYLRTHDDVVFDPFLWANALPLVANDDIIMDAPWIDQTITPLRPAPGSPVASNANALMEIPAADPPPRFDAILPVGKADAMLRASDIVVYSATPGEAQAGLSAYLGGAAAADFSCTHAADWSLTCVRKAQAAQRP